MIVRAPLTAPGGRGSPSEAFSMLHELPITRTVF